MKDKYRKSCYKCIHRIMGYSRTTQTEPVEVCAMKPKRIYLADIKHTDRQYFHSIWGCKVCEHYDDGHS